MTTQQPSYTNRLIHEKSPYLLQHAHNPVDWYPWGEEAFCLAKQEGKPIFLSIGYATCHWCHVMACESFENPDIAQLLNRSFVNVKVDREEMPHIDSLYMEFAQALMFAAGGWPLNLVLTPDLKPFFATTYLPLDTHRDSIGFAEVMRQIRGLWDGEARDKLIEQAEGIVDMFAKLAHVEKSPLPTEAFVEHAVRILLNEADPVLGGWKGGPKFPLSYPLDFLLEYARAYHEQPPLYFVKLTLDHMAAGGIYDHVGGGFARYSTDDRWHVPRFEKMLCDNALLASTYAQSWRFTRVPRYKQVAREIFAYLLRDMRSVEGGFYSAEDADSEGLEGRYYTWTPEEVHMAIASPDAERACAYYGISSAGNFAGRSILHVDTSMEELCTHLHISTGDLADSVHRARAGMFVKRGERPRPFRDDKILARWNGLVIDALAGAGIAMDVPEYLQVAEEAMAFVRREFWKEGKLLRRYREQECRFSAVLEDYAFLIKALLTLFCAGQGTAHLIWALELAQILERNFLAEGGAFYQTDQEELVLLRRCEIYDGAEPSGNAVHAENLVRLYHVTRDEKYLRSAEGILSAVKSLLDTYPPGGCYHLLALQRYWDTRAPTVVIVLDSQETLKEEIRAQLSQIFCPHLTTIWITSDDRALRNALPWLADKCLIEEKTTVYFCAQERCAAPVSDPQEIFRQFAHWQVI